MNIKKASYIGQLFSQYKVSIIDSGFATVDSEWNTQYVCSPFSRLYYIESGEGVINMKGRSIVLSPGKVYLIPLGTKYSCVCDDRLDHLYFHINIESPSGYDFFRGADCVFSEIPIAKIRHLTELYFDDSLISQIELQHEIYRSLAAVIKIQPTLPKMDKLLSPEIIKTIDYIKSNLSAQLSTEEIAAALFMSKNTLVKQFRREMGIPLGKYIDKLIFFEAEKLLTKSSASISEISADLGFGDQFYFSRRFKQLFEESPAAYRKRVLSLST